MRQIISLFLVLLLVVSFVGCKEEPKVVPSIYDVKITSPFDIEFVKAEDLKIGLITFGETGAEADLVAAIGDFGMKTEQLTVKSQVPETEESYIAACDLAEAGCKLIIADSPEYEEYMIKAASLYRGVQFCTIGGKRAKTELVGNYHSVYSTVYEGWYILGVAAGLKLSRLVEEGVLKEDDAKLGFVSELDDAQSISAYTAYYLGAKSVCEKVTMDVKVVPKRADNDAQTAAKALIDGGCRVLGYNFISNTVAQTCADNGVFCTGYNLDSTSNDSIIVSLFTSFKYYFGFAISSFINGEAIPTDYVSNIEEEAFDVSEINENAAGKGTKLYIMDARSKILNGNFSVFDINSFTCGGEAVASYLADVVYDKESVGDSEAVANGCFNESAMRSAPYFDLKIDGINIIK